MAGHSQAFVFRRIRVRGGGGAGLSEKNGKNRPCVGYGQEFTGLWRDRRGQRRFIRDLIGRRIATLTTTKNAII